MTLIDEQLTRMPFYGVLKMTAWLQAGGYEVNPKRIPRLMPRIGLEAIYPKPRTSQSGPDHKIYPLSFEGDGNGKLNSQGNGKQKSYGYGKQKSHRHGKWNSH